MLYLDTAFSDARLIPQCPQQLPQRLCSLCICKSMLSDLPQLVIVLLYECLCCSTCSKAPKLNFSYSVQPCAV